MKEFFDRLPPTGSLRPSRGYLERLHGAVERGSRVPQSLSYYGASGETSVGSWDHIDQQSVIWVEITAQPGSEDGQEGYSWEARQPRPGGGWSAPATMLRGDNGTQEEVEADASLAARAGNVATITTATSHGYSVGDFVTVDLNADEFDGTFRITSVTDTTFTYDQVGDDHAEAPVSGTTTVAARPRTSPAFDPNGDDAIPVGTIVALVRGYLHTSGTNAAGLPLIDPDDPDAFLNQEWLILGVAGDPSAARRFRIAGRPYSVGGVLMYPAYARQRRPDGAIADVPESSPKLVYVQSEYEQPLGTTGNFVVWARREGTVAIPDDPVDDPMGPATTYECWVTRDHICVVDVLCRDGEVVPIRDGKFEEEDETPSLDFSREGNSMYLPLLP